MYGFPQAGLLAQQFLENRLSKHRYVQSKPIPGFWKHKWRPICFTLLVDDFGVKNQGKESIYHLISVPKGHYDISYDWYGRKYVKPVFDLGYKGLKLHPSIPRYSKTAMQFAKHETPIKAEDQPYQHIPPNYGVRQKDTKPEGEAPKMEESDKTFFHQVYRNVPVLCKGCGYHNYGSTQ